MSGRRPARARAPSEPAGTPERPAPFRLTLFGRFQLQNAKGPVQLGNKKLCGLLAFLACAGPAPQPRDRLMSLFWGSHFETQARQNLRQALSRIRAALGEDALVSGDEAVALRPGVVDCDAVSFQSLIRDGSPAALRAAVDLYGDAFLADVRVREEGWTDWLTRERTRFETLAVSALLELGHAALGADKSEEAAALGRRAVEIDNLREDAHRLVMRGLAGAGQKSAALRHYDQLIGLLKRELDTGPDAATAALIDEIRAAGARGPAPDRTAKEAPALPDRPSIVVLPFENRSGDPGQDYFADGMMEDITTALSRLRWLFVIAANSSRTYKGEAPDVREVGRELGVRYVVEGSVRTSRSRVRVAVQLLDAGTGAHIWGSHYDRDLTEIFDVQDEITAQIVAAIEPNIRSIEIERVKSKPTESLDAYDLYLRALPDMYSLTEQGCQRAEGLLRQAVALDPGYSEALGALVDCIVRRWLNGWIPNQRLDSAKAEALQLTRRAIAADPQNGAGLAIAAYAFGVLNRRFDEGLELAERAVSAHPNSAYVRTLCGHVFVHSGEFETGLGHFEVARRLDPLDPRGYQTLSGIAISHLFGRRFAEAVHWAQRAKTLAPSWAVARRYLAAALAHLGRIEEARAEIRDLLAMQPNSSLSRSRTSSFRDEWMYDIYIDGLRLAGLPES